MEQTQMWNLHLKQQKLSSTKIQENKNSQPEVQTNQTYILWITLNRELISNFDESDSSSSSDFDMYNTFMNFMCEQHRQKYLR